MHAISTIRKLATLHSWTKGRLPYGAPHCIIDETPTTITTISSWNPRFFLAPDLHGRVEEGWGMERSSIQSPDYRIRATEPKTSWVHVGDHELQTHYKIGHSPQQYRNSEFIELTYTATTNSNNFQRIRPTTTAIDKKLQSAFLPETQAETTNPTKFCGIPPPWGLVWRGIRAEQTPEQRRVTQHQLALWRPSLSPTPRPGPWRPQQGQTGTARTTGWSTWQQREVQLQQPNEELPKLPL